MVRFGLFSSSSGGGSKVNVASSSSPGAKTMAAATGTTASTTLSYDRRRGSSTSSPFISLQDVPSSEPCASPSNKNKVSLNVSVNVIGSDILSSPTDAPRTNHARRGTPKGRTRRSATPSWMKADELYIEYDTPSMGVGGSKFMTSTSTPTRSTMDKEAQKQASPFYPTPTHLSRRTNVDRGSRTPSASLRKGLEWTRLRTAIGQYEGEGEGESSDEVSLSFSDVSLDEGRGGEYEVELDVEELSEEEEEGGGSDSESDLSEGGSEEEGEGEGKGMGNESEGWDSEEELWPVNPARFGTVALTGVGSAKSKVNMSKGKGRRKEEGETQRIIRLATMQEEDPLDGWGKWGKGGWNVVRRSRTPSTMPRSASTAPRPTPSSSSAVQEWEEVSTLLSTLKLQKEAEEESERRAFEERNKALWSSIESCIKSAEAESARLAAEEAARVAERRKRMEEMERRARDEREREEKRMEEERRREEERKGEVERERKELEEKERMGRFVGTDNVRAQARLEYARFRDVMQRVKTQVLPVVSSNPELRKQCFAAKRQITPKVGQLTNSRSEIERITLAIHKTLCDAKSSNIPEAYTWILNHLSKCLIRQAEQEVQAKQEAAFPLGRLVLWLLAAGHEELGQVLMARLVKKCCWCVPYCPPKEEGQDEASYAKVQGYASADESQTQYSARIGGILAFYFSICQTDFSPPPPSLPFIPGSASNVPPSFAAKPSDIPEHFRTSALWKWQTRALLAPLRDLVILPSLWSVLLEICGPKLLSTYPRQQVKLWRLLLEEGLRGEKMGFCTIKEARPATARLRMHLEEWEMGGGRGIKEATKGREPEP